MSDKILGMSNAPPKENDLYNIIELHGRRFEIRYGYYEEIDRAYEPIPIYPDFIKEPVYTDDGAPFVTLMQNPCESFEPSGRCSDLDCGNCKHMERGEELIAVCRCTSRRKNE